MRSTAREDALMLLRSLRSGLRCRSLSAIFYRDVNHARFVTRCFVRTPMTGLINLIICIASLGCVARAHGEPVLASVSVDKVLGFYRTQEILNDSIEFVEKELKAQAKDLNITPNKVAHILGIAQRIYPAKNLLPIFTIAYEKTISQQALADLYKWMNSVLGIKVRQAYTAFYAATPQERRLYFKQEGKRSLKPNRKNALQTFIITSDRDGLFIEKFLGGALAAEMALNSLVPPNRRLDARTINQRVQKRGKMPSKEAREIAMVMDFFLLKSLKNEEVDELTKFAASPTGHAAISAYRKALQLTYQAAAQTLANEVAKAVSEP